MNVPLLGEHASAAAVAAPPPPPLYRFPPHMFGKCVGGFLTPADAAKLEACSKWCQQETKLVWQALAARDRLGAALPDRRRRLCDVRAYYAMHHMRQTTFDNLVNDYYLASASISVCTVLCVCELAGVLLATIFVLRGFYLAALIILLYVLLWEASLALVGGLRMLLRGRTGDGVRLQWPETRGLFGLLSPLWPCTPLRLLITSAALLLLAPAFCLALTSGGGQRPLLAACAATTGLAALALTLTGERVVAPAYLPWFKAAKALLVAATSPAVMLAGLRAQGWLQCGREMVLLPVWVACGLVVGGGLVSFCFCCCEGGRGGGAGGSAVREGVACVAWMVAFLVGGASAGWQLTSSRDGDTSSAAPFIPFIGLQCMLTILACAAIVERAAQLRHRVQQQLEVRLGGLLLLHPPPVIVTE